MFSFDDRPDIDAIKARALENVRAMVEWKRQDNSLMHDSADVLPIRSVAIVGAGVMGTEIAAAHFKHNLPVTIFDNNPATLVTIADRTLAEIAEKEDSGDVRKMVVRLLQPTSELTEVAKCDLIIETILEKLPAKQDIYARLSELLPHDAIVTSNTSTIPIGKLAESVSSPERFCGFHFCHPVWQRPLVEIIRGPKTSDKTIAALVAHARTIDKLPIVVADGPGFLVNRLLLPYLIEAMELLVEGSPIEEIENAAVEFGMAKGPFRLMDEIGLDTTLHAGWSMAAAFPDRIPASPLLVAMIKSGRLGRKSGAGFFSYPNISQGDSPIFAKRKSGQSPDAASVANYIKPDPAAMEILAPWIKSSKKHSAEDIVLRLILPMVAEAKLILEEGKVGDPRDIDLCVIFGLGFPARRGGLLWWADASLGKSTRHECRG